MQVILLAGGKGTRLFPITQTRPKPMVPIQNEPVMAHILRLLAKNGIDHVTVTTHYLGDQIQNYFGDTFEQMHLQYQKEELPLGTAGGVKLAASGKEDVLVISGDAFCETDLQNAIAFHKKKRADATLILSRVENPLEYGVVVCDANGKILGFLEKPSYTQACTDTVNTGIYLLSPRAIQAIPAKIPYDFGQDLFPKLLAAGAELYGYVSKEPWCDIGSLESYYACNFAQCNLPNILAPDVQVAASAQLRGTILMDGCEIGENSVVTDSILCEQVQIGNGCVIEKGCVIGANCKLGNSVHIRKGTILPPNLEMEEETICMQNFTFSQTEARQFDEYGLLGNAKELTPEFVLRLGKAAAKVGSPVGMLSDMHPQSQLCADTFLCGVRAAGGECYRFGTGFAAMAAFGARTYATPLTVAFSMRTDGLLRIRFFDETGCYPSRKTERALAQALTQTTSLDETVSLGSVSEIPDLANRYRDALGESLSSPLLSQKIMVSENAPGELLAQVLRKAGARVTQTADALRLILDEDGFSVSLFELGEHPFACDQNHILAMLLQHRPVSEPVLLPLPYTVPQAVSDAASQAGYQVAHFAHAASDPKELQARQNRKQFPFLWDGLFLSLALLSDLEKRQTCAADFAKTLPAFCTTERNFGEKGVYYGNLLAKVGTPDGDGVCVIFDARRRVRFIPHRHFGVQIVCEAENAEAAEELFAFSEQELRRLQENEK